MNFMDGNVVEVFVNLQQVKEVYLKIEAIKSFVVVVIGKNI